ncbi:restriction endonuclease subunit S [Sorangium sp. So ce260]|uniref:restriction endonuclease subunit S n=1 Tax=Sorangium sp. So ce260 TaxID=3133291 RepID=UPI003F6146F5
MMPEGWSESTLGDLTDLITKGTTPTTTGQPYTDSGVPFLRVENITEGGGIDAASVKYISRKTHDTFRRSQLRPGDVLLSIAGALGRVCLIPNSIPEANINQAIALVRLSNIASSKISATFLAYQLRSEFVREQIRLGSAQLAQANLNLKQVGELRLLLPPVGEQRKIGAILSSVDEAIEATKAVIDQLQVVKKAMMAELLTRGLPGRHTRFKKTEIGEVPEGWEVLPLGTLLVRGPDNGLYKPQSDYGTGTLIVRIDAFANGECVNGDGLRRVRASDEEVRRFHLHEGDILINRVNSLSHLGKVGFVSAPPEPIVFESNMMRLAVDSVRVLPSFAFLVLASPMTKASFLQSAKQAVAQASINQQDVRAVSIPLPSLPEQAAISSAIENIDVRAAAESNYLELLSGVKSTLLSALLTGEIRVTPDEASP